MSEGQAHDLDGADALLPGLIPKIKALLADRAYEGANKSGTFEKSLDKWAESVSDWGFYAERREKGRAWIHQKRKHLR